MSAGARARSPGGRRRRPPWRAVAVALALGAALARPARADVYDEAWQRGHRAYRDGDHAAALAAYQELDRAGIVSGDLYYNLGVVHFRLGALGPAAWSFQRALALDPDDEDAAFNLEQVRKLLALRPHDKLEGAEGDPLWVRAATLGSPAAQTWAFALAYVALFALLWLRQRRRGQPRAGWTAAVALAGLLAAALGGQLAGRAALARIPFAVVLPDKLAVREGPEEGFRQSFALHAGLRVRIVESEADWVRIRLANGLEGWVRAGDVGRL